MVYETKIQSLQEVSQKIRDLQQKEIILKREFVMLHEVMGTQKRVNEALAQDLDRLTFENKKLQKINQDMRV